MAKAFFELLGVFLNWTKSQLFDKLYQIFLNCNCTNANYTNYIGKINKNISFGLKDWNVWSWGWLLKLQKRFQVFQSSFSYVKFIRLVTQKNEDKGPNMHNPNQFMAFQNYSIIFLDEFLMWFYLQDLVYFEAHFQEHETLQKVKVSMDTLAQHLE